jgi:nicotinamide phosphoribosyltransferase
MIQAPQNTRPTITARKFVLPAVCALDSYKFGHEDQYVEGTECVVSNWTPRSLEHFKAPTDPVTGQSFSDDRITWMGTQQIIHALVTSWDETFFQVDFETAYINFARRAVVFTSGRIPSRKRLSQLHTYGRLPLTIMSLPEGSRVNIRVPTMIIYNTQKWAYWLTNRVETFISAELWQIPTSATICSVYRTITEVYGERTGCDKEFRNWQNHDFSPRGMGGMMSAASSGTGHLVYSLGTDNVPAVEKVAQIYRGDEGFIGGSICATEHSVMTLGGVGGEFELIKNLIVNVYPGGMISVVCDQYDYWKVISEYAPAMLKEIRARLPDSYGMKKVVFRPDSGNPVKIVTGTVYYATPEQEGYSGDYAISRIMADHKSVPFGEFDTHIYWRGAYWPVNDRGTPLNEPTPSMLGSAELLRRTFGCTVNDKGFMVVSSDVGLIYGDSITMQRSVQIQHRLWQRGICTSVVVLGLGSFTYQYVTRDTLGQAVKATFAYVNGKPCSMQKMPKTDSGTKVSARGLLNVIRNGDDWVLVEDAETLYAGEMRDALSDGYIVQDDQFQEIRDRAMPSLMKYVETFFKTPVNVR